MEAPQEKLVYIFSLLSGEIYKVFESELKVLDKYQIPLKAIPSSSCRKCYGRGHRGKNITLNVYTICPCMHKIIDYNRAAEEITVETPKQIY